MDFSATGSHTSGDPPRDGQQLESQGPTGDHATSPGTDPEATGTGSLELAIRESRLALTNSCPASPLILAEGLHGLEPGPKSLLSLNVVKMDCLLEQEDLLGDFEFLGERT